MKCLNTINQPTKTATLRLLICLLFTLMQWTAWGQLTSWFPAKDMSNSNITDIVQDKYNLIWIGTEHGLNKFDGYRFTYYLANADDPGAINDNIISALHVDAKGDLWVGTRHGLNWYDYDRDCFVPIHFDTDLQPRIKQIISTPKGDVYCATAGYGLYRIVRSTQPGHEMMAVRDSRFCQENQDDYYHTIAVDSQGRFWKSDHRGFITCFHERGGKVTIEASMDSQMGDVLDIMPENRQSTLIICQFGLIRYNGETFDVLDLSDLHLEFSAVCRKQDQQLLLGTVGHGVWAIDDNGKSPIRQVAPGTEDIDLTTTDVRAICEDHQGNTWIGCAHKGLMMISQRPTPFHTWAFSSHKFQTSSKISAIAPSGQHDLWVALQNHGMYLLSEGNVVQSYEHPANISYIYRDWQNRYWLGAGNNLYAFNPANGQTRLEYSFQWAHVRTMTDDRKRLYVSTFSKGLMIIDPATGESRQIDMYHPLNNDEEDRLCNDWILGLLCDSRGYIWCATSAGLCCYDPEKDTFLTLGWHVQLNEMMCQCISEDANGDILIGTNMGLYKYDMLQGKVTPAPADCPMTEESVSSIICMADGDLWMSTTGGIWHYNATQKTMQPYIHASGLSDHEFSIGVGRLLPSGDIIFGQHDGLVWFDPEQVIEATREPRPLTLTNFLVGGYIIHPFTLSGDKPICTQSIQKAHEFTLSHQDNSFSMEFSSFAFDEGPAYHIEYSIDGGRWLSNYEGHNAISFTHMQPGTYHLSVRSSRHNIVSEATDYVIHIRSPWYSSWWARTLYGFLLLLILSVLFYTWWRHKRNQLEDERMQLLIDAAQDIHTPITKILSPLHELIRRATDPDDAEKLQTIDHNARRIQGLINQILNVRNIDKVEIEPLRQTESDAAPTNVQPSRKQRILLVDGDEELTNFISSELGSRYRIRVCNNGLEAMQLLQAGKESYDIVVGDVAAPDLDGYKLLRSIKTNSDIAHIPVILLSAATEINYRLEALSAGADAFLNKPFAIQELQVMIDSLIANC